MSARGDLERTWERDVVLPSKLRRELNDGDRVAPACRFDSVAVVAVAVLVPPQQQASAGPDLDDRQRLVTRPARDFAKHREAHRRALDDVGLRTPRAQTNASTSSRCKSMYDRNSEVASSGAASLPRSR